MPDLSTTTSICINAIPRTPESYGPFSAIADYSSALDGPCIGAICVQDTQEGIHVFAGSSDKLYKLDAGSTTFTNISAATPAYAVTPGEAWRFAQWKNTLLATAWGNPIQTFVLGTGSAFATLSSAAPQARFIAAVAGFLMVANTYDPVGGYAPFRTWWSAQNDPTTWPTPGSAQAQQVMSDYNDLAGAMGDITGLVGGLVGCDGLLFFQRGIHRIMFAGPPAVFTFQPAEGARGTRAPNSIVQLGGMVFYLGEDGFYAFDGMQSVPIGANKVDKWFLTSLNQGYLYNVIGGVDVASKTIGWIFPSLNSTSGVPDTALFYNWQLQRWGMAQLSVEWVLKSLSQGYTMDSMASAGFANLDAVPFSLDAPFWVGGAPLLAAFNAATHKLATFTGGYLQAEIGTQAVQLVPGQKAFVSGARPLVDGGAPTVAISARDTLQAAETFGADAALNAIGDCPQRVTGRYLRARVTVPAGSNWTHFRGVDVTARPAGIR